MAKKKTDTTENPAPEAASPAAEARAAAPKKAKEPRAKEAKTKPAGEGAVSPGPPAAAPALTAAPEATTPTAPMAPPTESTKKKGRQPGHPPSIGKKLKNQLKALKQKIDKEEALPLKRAVAFLKQSKRAKFDETVEIHMSLGIDTTQNDQMVRGSVPLPHGIGKAVRVLMFCQGDNVAKAKEAGADHAGGDDLIKKIQQEGWLDFDVALATQDMMGMVSRLGKVLGPRGLMPTPKAGTVITT